MKLHVQGRPLLLIATLVMVGVAIRVAYVATEPRMPPQAGTLPRAQAKASPQPSAPSSPTEQPGSQKGRQQAASPPGPVKEAAVDPDGPEHALAQLRDADPEVRASAAEKLAAFPSAAIEPELIRVLRTDSQAAVRAAAARSFAAFEHPSTAVWQALLGSIRDPSDDVRSMTLNALHSMLAARTPKDAEIVWVRREIHALQVSPQLSEPVRESLQTLLVGEDSP